MNTVPRSLIERLGFSDPDRKSPLHDQIQIWAYHQLSLILESLASAGTSFFIIGKRIECPVFNEGRKQILGFIDLVAEGYYTNQHKTMEPFRVSIEVKTSIPSCGELVRQINFYRSFEGIKNVWVVVSPDDRYQDILRESNIYFFRYAGSQQLPLDLA